MEPQIRYVAVDKNGEVVGPTDKKPENVKKALIIGYLRSRATAFLPHDPAVWNRIMAMGYEIKKMAANFVKSVCYGLKHKI